MLGTHKKGRQVDTSCRPNEARRSITGFRHVRRLGTFRSLDYLELDRVALLKSTVTLSHYRGIMDENIWSIISPNETISFLVIKPLDIPLHFVPPPYKDSDISDHKARPPRRALPRV